MRQSSVLQHRRLCPKVSGLAAWSENSKWQFYRYFMSQSSEFYRHNHLCCFPTNVCCCCCLFRYRISLETFEYTLVVHPPPPHTHTHTLTFGDSRSCSATS
jgi:hypothetical protein